MRSFQLTIAVFAVTTGRLAVAQDAVTPLPSDPMSLPADIPVVVHSDIQPEAYDPPRLPRFGAMADVGVPGFFAGSVVYRPTKWLRIHAGGAYNLISSGVQGGMALLPFGSGPSLTVEAGHMFDGNANATVRKVIGSNFEGSPALQRVGYDYGTAHLGLDFGVRRVTFYLHAGVSYLRSTVHDAGAALQDAASSGGYTGSDTTLVVKQDPVIKVFGPSAKIGLIVYLM